MMMRVDANTAAISHRGPRSPRPPRRHHRSCRRERDEGDNESAMKDLSVALRLRPAYLEAIRLREKILAETDPGEAKKLERIILEEIDLKEAPKWIRR